MDDMKRAIYLDVLSSLKETDCYTHICNQLYFRLKPLLPPETSFHQDLLYEFFPEFFALHDGYRYGRDYRGATSTANLWFARSTRHARLSLINFLLTHR